jgi:phosphate transport system substrate-binding protein
MAQLGYSPLPPVLSQEMANSIGRLTGSAPEQLNASNCNNPRFSGSLGVGAQSPRDPYLGLDGFTGNPDPGETTTGSQTTGDGGSAGGPAGASGPTRASGPAANSGAVGPAATGAGTGATGAEAEASAGAGAGRAGSGAASAGGGSTEWRSVEPVLYARAPLDASRWPLIVFLAVLALPVGAVTIGRRVARSRSGLPPGG